MFGWKINKNFQQCAVWYTETRREAFLLQFICEATANCNVNCLFRRFLRRTTVITLSQRHYSRSNIDKNTSPDHALIRISTNSPPPSPIDFPNSFYCKLSITFWLLISLIFSLSYFSFPFSLFSRPPCHICPPSGFGRNNPPCLSWTYFPIYCINF